MDKNSEDCKRQGISMLSESISNCTGLDEVCTIDLKLNRTRLMFSEIIYIFLEMLGL
jgi:hypothetical protein